MLYRPLLFTNTFYEWSEFIIVNTLIGVYPLFVLLLTDFSTAHGGYKACISHNKAVVRFLIRMVIFKVVPVYFVHV